MRLATLHLDLRTDDVQVMLADFELVYKNSASLKSHQGARGTLNYMAPENYDDADPGFGLPPSDA